MTLKPTHELILLALAESPLLTENELIAAICKGSSLRSQDIEPRIAKLLTELKDDGLIWTGQLFNRSNQFMWAATLTKRGRELHAKK
jgi:hypothetical protein